MHRRHFLKTIGKGLLTTATYGTGLIYALPAWAKSAFEYALEGQELIQNKNFEKAVNVLKKAAQADPENDWIHGLLGRAYLGQGKKAEAAAAFREAMRLNPADVYSRMMVEKITQKPLPKLKKAEKPLSQLEINAQKEEAAMLDKLKSEKGLGYSVKRVVIDPGHGGFDPGAVGLNGLKEKDVTLDIAQKLNQRLNASGKVKAFLTRTDDYYIPLSARTVTANQYQADLFVSIHINANQNRSAKGSETYFCSEKASSAEAKKVAELENSVLKFDEPHKKTPGYIDIEEILFKFEQKLYWSESGNFANFFQERIKKNLPFKSRGIHSANFYVLRRAKMPSILLETGFISNPKEEELLKKAEFRNRIVDSIIRGFV